MKRGPEQRGQALTEMALLAPLFAVVLLVLASWARLAVTRLALVQLTRDSAILLARNSVLWGDSEARQLLAVRKLAERQGILDPGRLRLSLKPLPPPLLGPLMGLDLPMDSPIAGWVGEKLFGRRCTLRYQVPLGGLLGRFFPHGLALEESVAVLGDPWTMKGSDGLGPLLQ